MLRHGLNWYSSSVYGQMAGACVCNNKISGSSDFGNFLIKWELLTLQ